MTKKKIARKKPATKAPAPESITPSDAQGKKAATAPEPIPPRPISAWDGQSDGSPNPDAPLDVLVEAMFDDFNGEHADRTTTFLTKVLRSVADDVELVALAGYTDGDGLDHSPAIARVLCRVENRSRIAVEVARRIQRGQS